MDQQPIGMFFDRNDTINTQRNPVRIPEELRSNPQSVEAIHEANEPGVTVLIATGQSGTAGGFFSEGAFRVARTQLYSFLKRMSPRIAGIAGSKGMLQQPVLPSA